jgi:hypothetical protein
VGTNADKTTTDGQADKSNVATAVSADEVKRKDPLTIAVNGSDEWALRGSNPRPHGCDTESVPTDPQADQSVAPPPSGACTSACTQSEETAKDADVHALAVELVKLPKEQRERLLASLLDSLSASD